jgi:hypothetical protein
VETLAGRRCPLPGIASPDWRTRGEAERKAVNTPMQVRSLASRVYPAACHPLSACQPGAM